MVATGRYNEPVHAAVAGERAIAGSSLHSCRLPVGPRVCRERVLVVGLGNTGAEIAADLVEQGAERRGGRVRTPPPIVRREILGVPVQLFGIALYHFQLVPARPPCRGDARVGTGDLRQYGIGPAPPRARSPRAGPP